MDGYIEINLNNMITEIGEDSSKAILSNFSCPLNKDVESFLRDKAITFAQQGWARTHLIFTSYKGNVVLIGYYAVTIKDFSVYTKHLNSKTKRKISKFGSLDKITGAYKIPAPLIAQLGKNYSNGYNNLIKGEELLKLACDKIAMFQLAIGGRIVYLECEDKDKLIEFYERNGFFQFWKRKLDRDETGLMDGDYLVQMLKFLS